MKKQTLSYTLLCRNCKTFDTIRHNFQIINIDINSKVEALEFLNKYSNETCNDCHSKNVGFRNIELDGKSFNKIKDKVNSATIYNSIETDEFMSNCFDIQLGRVNNLSEKEFNLYLRVNELSDITRWKLTSEMIYKNEKYIIFEEQISGRIALLKEVAKNYIYMVFAQNGSMDILTKIDGFIFE